MQSLNVMFVYVTSEHCVHTNPRRVRGIWIGRFDRRYFEAGLICSLLGEGDCERSNKTGTDSEQLHAGYLIAVFGQYAASATQRVRRLEMGKLSNATQPVGFVSIGVRSFSPEGATAARELRSTSHKPLTDRSKELLPVAQLCTASAHQC